MSLSITTPLILSAILIAFCEGCDYPTCWNGVPNIGCDASIGSNCVNYTECTVSDDDIQTILDAHNSIRKDIIDGKYYKQFGGKATNMQKLTWNPELAKLAKASVDKCTGKHDQCRNYPTANDPIGQNLHMSSIPSGGTPNNWEKPVKSWFDGEMKHIKPSDLRKMPLDYMRIGHLTQVAWAKTNQIGCACSKFYAHEWNQMAILQVCNYGPSGNFRGAEVFSTKKGCPPGTTKDSDGFCVSS